jgi:hypothetical protein
MRSALRTTDGHGSIPRSFPQAGLPMPQRTTIVLDPSRRNSPAESKGPIVKNNENYKPGNFACKDKNVRRDQPQVSMNINAENNGRFANRREALLAALPLPSPFAFLPVRP